MDARAFPLALALGLAMSAAYAGEPVYKSTMPDGRVMYGESPQPGAKRVDKVAAPPEVSGVITITPEDRARAANIPAPTSAVVTVIPEQKRKPTMSPTAGQSENAGDKLPSRSY